MHHITPDFDHIRIKAIRKCNVIDKATFSRLFAELDRRCCSPANLVACFEAMGIYPFNRNAIDPKLFLPQGVVESFRRSNDAGSIESVARFPLNVFGFSF